MKKIGVFMAEGCEEIEALTVVDMLRRAGIEVAMISVSGKKEVKGSHNITFLTDIPAEYMDFDVLDGVVLPGGMPGTINLKESEIVQKIIHQFAAENKLVSAICAAPSVLGEAGLLKEKKATSYPGFEDKLIGASVVTDAVAVDGNIITSRSMGTAIPFSLEIIRFLLGDEAVAKLSDSIVFEYC